VLESKVDEMIARADHNRDPNADSCLPLIRLKARAVPLCRYSIRPVTPGPTLVLWAPYRWTRWASLPSNL
jgi:hypothetical protein